MPTHFVGRLDLERQDPIKGDADELAVERLDHMRFATLIDHPCRPSSVPLPIAIPAFGCGIALRRVVDPWRPHYPQQMTRPRCTSPRRHQFRTLPLPFLD
jgi:hypothetical protein